MFIDFFDIIIGNKKDLGSYKKIVEKIGVSLEEILFLIDTFEGMCRSNFICKWKMLLKFFY